MNWSDIHAARRERAAAIIAAGKGLADFAHTEGITQGRAMSWLKRWAPSCHAAFRDETPAGAFTAHQALVRLMLIQSVSDIPRGVARLAKALGVSHAALIKFRHTWAPDGLDVTIREMLEEMKA